MTSIPADAIGRSARASAPVAATRGRRAIRIWLWVVAAFVLAMVVVGGATRLTDSGLSITEWKPIHGVIPPLSAAEWEEEFAKYQQIPQYEVFNHGMTLSEFKGIFWWEWAHRLLGRLVGVVFALPLIVFALRGWVERRLWPRLGILFVLGGLQGAVGWWMVASGLTERTDVSQLRLATHLTLACIIFAACLWVAEGLRPGRSARGRAALAESRGLRVGGGILVALVFVQIFLGALVAGLNAGLIYNTWPLMGDGLVPPGLMAQSPALANFYENLVTVQFDHRMVAYLVTLVIVVHAVFAWRGARNLGTRTTATLLVIGVLAQVAAGIATLVSRVPIDLALLHQGLAVALLGLTVVHARRMTPPTLVTDAAALPA